MGFGESNKVYDEDAQLYEYGLHNNVITFLKNHNKGKKVLNYTKLLSSDSETERNQKREKIWLNPNGVIGPPCQY